MLVFYYEISELVKKVTQKSIYHAKHAKDEQGNPMIDKISVGPEDETFIKSLIKKAAIELFSMMEPYTHELADLDDPLEGFEWDATYDTTDNCVIFRVVETETMPTTVVKLMENSIESALVNYPVGHFLVHNQVDGTLYIDLWNNDKDNVLSYINRRSGLKRTYKLY